MAAQSLSLFSQILNCSYKGNQELPPLSFSSIVLLFKLCLVDFWIFSPLAQAFSRLRLDLRASFPFLTQPKEVFLCIQVIEESPRSCVDSSRTGPCLLNLTRFRIFLKQG